MNVFALKQMLNMWPDDMEVYIQTTPDDLCQPLTQKAFSTISASYEEKYNRLNQAKLLITSYHPDKVKP